MSNRECNYCRNDERDYREEQRHVHEFEESVKFAEEDEDRHNHRTAGVTGEAILVGGGRHVHRIYTNTDFGDHYHEIRITTGIDIPIRGTNKHIHVISGRTSRDDDHRHEFLFTTQIEAPTV